MPRHGMAWLGIVALLWSTGARLAADAPEVAPPDPVKTTLALQQAMVMARAFLRVDDAKKAVDVLEQNLARVNGNTAYLELLRDAYRAYVKELGLKSQSAIAKLYLQRLTILDPTAANDPTLQIANEPPKIVPTAPRDDKPLLPNFAAAQAKNALPPKEEGASSPAAPSTSKAPIIRAIRELPGDDPFDLANQRSANNRVAALNDPAKFTAILSKGHEEFERRRYAEARKCYEQLVELDGKAIEQVRDRLAYCLLDSAVEQLNRTGGVPLAEVRKQVVGAVALSPQHRRTADWLLKEIDQRVGPTIAGSAPESLPDPPLNMQHFGKNPQGWQVTETTNFLIFHNQNRDLVERAALIAERTRQAMTRKWFGGEGEAWNSKCEIVIHGSASEYSRLTKVPANSPGHTCIKRDPTTFRVVGRRIDLHIENMTGMLEAVLPHETTHVVLAGNFGNLEVPRWADEGVAVLTEPLEKIEQHRRNLSKSQKEGLLVPLRDLMTLQDYPQARQITAFYAQSVMLVEFLSQKRGPQVFTEFLRDGLKDGYENALRKHYGWSHADLQASWDQHVAGGGRQTVAAGR